LPVSERDPQPKLYGSRLFLTRGPSKQSAGQVRDRLAQIHTIEQVEHLTWIDGTNFAFLEGEVRLHPRFEASAADLQSVGARRQVGDAEENRFPRLWFAGSPDGPLDAAVELRAGQPGEKHGDASLEKNWFHVSSSAWRTNRIEYR
jgi:hypothetical protein